jgi:hypothetical protein
MKKLKILVLTLLVSNFNYAQDGNSTLVSILKPAESRGYICWIAPSNATKYEVQLLQRNDDNSYSVLESKTTTTNFALLNMDFIRRPNVFYTITAFNNAGIQISEGGPYSMINGVTWDETCYHKCNGTSYAWQISMVQNDVYTLMSPAKLQLRSTSKAVDYTTGVVVPYYQAFSTTAYNAIPAGHPYKEVDANILNLPSGLPNYTYKHIQINSSTPGGPFYNAQGAQVTEGWLVEKKMDQFKYMEFNTTNIFQPSSTECDATLLGAGGVLSYFNTHLDPTTLQSPPTSSEFVSTIPTQLQCLPQLGSPASGGYTYGESDINSSEANFFEDCWTMASIQATLNCLGYEVVNVPIDGLEISKVNSPGNVITIDYSNETSMQQIPNLNLSKGLYRLRFFMNQGDVVDIYTEQKLDEAADVFKNEFAKMIIQPNQIINDEINIKIESLKDMAVNLTVNSMDGTELYNENFDISETNDIYKKVPVNSGSYSYNQLLVRLTFSDGSYLQKTAVRY